jgi:hypothetical protein
VVFEVLRAGSACSEDLQGIWSSSLQRVSFPPLRIARRRFGDRRIKPFFRCVFKAATKRRETAADGRRFRKFKFGELVPRIAGFPPTEDQYSSTLKAVRFALAKLRVARAEEPAPQAQTDVDPIPKLSYLV